MSYIPAGSPLRVDVLDGTTFEVISANVDLSTCLEDDDERDAADATLRREGRVWIGGGAAALFYVRVAQIAPAATARRAFGIVPVLPFLLGALMAMASACSSATAPASPTIAGEWIAPAAAGPFASLRMVLGTNADGSTYGTAYADLKNCYSARPLDCHLMGDVSGDAPRGDDVTFTLSFPAYFFRATATGRVDDDVFAGTITEQLTTSPAVSTPAAITFRRSR